MNTRSERPKDQWRALERTTAGREQIVEAYARVMGEYGGKVPVLLAYDEMIDVILRERFPVQAAAPER
jgi:hypothetical protein